MILIADVLWEIPAQKKMVREMSKKPRFTGPLDKQHGKRAKKFLQS